MRRRSHLTRRGVILAAPAIVLASALGSRVWAGDFATDSAPGELVVRLRPGVSQDVLLSVLQRHNATIVRSFAPISPRDWEIACPPGTEAALASELLALGLAERVDAVPVPHPTATPADPGFSIDAFFNSISAPAVWDRFKMVDFPSAPPVIDIDGGVRGTFSGGVFTPTHTDLPGTIITQTWNIPLASTDVTDTSGHGTAVMGIMCAIANNGVATAGIGWGGTGIPVKVVSTGDNIAAFAWIVANIPPPSFVCYPIIFNGAPPQAWYDGVVALYNAGHLLFGATGDSAASPCKYGAADVPAPYAVAVTGCTATYARALDYASYGPSPSGTGQGATACAPGGNPGANPAPQDLLSTLNFTGSVNNFGSGAQGTSFSAPVVCAIARFLSAIAPDLSILRIREIVTDQNLTHPCTGFGASPIGCIDFDNCVRAVQSRLPFSPG